MWHMASIKAAVADKGYAGLAIRARITNHVQSMSFLEKEYGYIKMSNTFHKLMTLNFIKCVTVLNDDLEEQKRINASQVYLKKLAYALPVLLL